LIGSGSRVWQRQSCLAAAVVFGSSVSAIDTLPTDRERKSAAVLDSVPPVADETPQAAIIFNASASATSIPSMAAE